jgi:hypothetical protein
MVASHRHAFRRNNMPKKFTLLSSALTTVAILLGSVPANAQAPKPTPTPTPQSQKRYRDSPLDELRTPRPQNQSIVNTTKSNTKDRAVVRATPTPSATPVRESKSEKGWDGKVQGKKIEGRLPVRTPTPTPPKG